MAPSRHPHHRRQRTAAPAAAPPEATAADWLSLTDLGRLYGLSAVHTGRLLIRAGLRCPSGDPSAPALENGVARLLPPGRPHQAAWSRSACAPHLEDLGLMPVQQRRLVDLWADLLHALQQGSPGIATSAEEMAGELPHDLVTPVNRELRQRGCSFQVKPLRRAATPPPAGSPSRAALAGDPHPCD